MALRTLFRVFKPFQDIISIQWNKGTQVAKNVTTVVIKDAKKPYYFPQIFNRYKPAYSNVYINKAQKLMNRGGCLLAFGSLVLVNSDEERQKQEGESFFSELKEGLPQLSTINFENIINNSQLFLNNIIFEKQLAKGCCGVVYSASLKNNELPPFNLDDGHFGSTNTMEDKRGKEKLAIKMMFNYSLDSMSSIILQGMQREMLPLSSEFIQEDGTLTRWKNNRFSLPQHPNIIKMYGAFVDNFNVLPDGDSYKDALPWKSHGYGHNMTLYIVMKQYETNLEDYLKNYKPSYKVTHLLYTQLMEALSHLSKNNVSHRDLKPNNILIDLSRGIEEPQLVLADFGNALAVENLKIKSSLVGSVTSLGGNTYYMAPEIFENTNSRDGILDFSKSDLWTSGVLAYKLFVNEDIMEKFRLNEYNIFSLPPLPKDMHPALQYLIRSSLNKDPTKRQRPEFIANVCQLLLHFPKDLLASCSRKAVICWLALRTLNIKSKCADLSLEQQLGLSFFHRASYTDIINGLEFIKSFSYIQERN